MKAVQFSSFGGPEVLELVERPDPVPGPGEVRIAVRAAGVNASDWKKRRGLMDPELPQTLGYEAAGVVDLLGAGVTEVAVGDRVFGLSGSGAAQAELAVLSFYARIPPSLSFSQAATLPSATETAARALDQLGIEQGSVSGVTVLISGASGTIGSAAVQLAIARGARVIGSASASNADYLASLGATFIDYRLDLFESLETVAPRGVDLALDVAGSGILPELIAVTGSAEQVLTLADFPGSQQHGVRFSKGDGGRALYILTQIAPLIEAGVLQVPDVLEFPLADVAQAQQASEFGKTRAKIVLVN